MTAEEVKVQRTLYWIAIGLIGTNLPLTIAELAGRGHVYRPWVAESTVAAVGGLLTWASIRLARGRLPILPLQFAVVASVVLLAVHPYLMVERVGYPPLLHVLGATMSVAAVISVRWSLVIVPLFSFGVVVLRAPFLGMWQSVVEGLLFATGGFVGTVAFWAFGEAGRTVRASVEQSWKMAENRARLAERSAARERWDGLVHDTALGALSLASRSRDGNVPDSARDLAKEALSALRGGAPSASSAVDRWRDHAARLGLVAVFRVDGEISDPEVREAVTGAVLESLTNVYRHSGTQEVVVSGHLDDHETWLAVTDRGHGVPPGSSPGVGLRTSVMGRMQAVGGNAEIRSHPSGGTQIVVTWQPGSDEPPGTEATTWELRSFRPLVFVAWVVLSLVVVVSHPHWSVAVLPWVSLVLIGVMAVATWVATTFQPRRPVCLAVVFTIAAVGLTGVLNTPLDEGASWRYWYLSALNPALVGLSYRFSRWAATWALGGTILIVVLVDLAVGRPWWTALVLALPVMVGTVVAVQWVRFTLAEAWRTLQETTRQEAELRLAKAAESEREREAQLRIGILEQTVGPSLDRLVSGGQFDITELADLDLLGSAVRDQLAAPELLDAILVTELRRARSRGVMVDVVAIDDPSRVGEAVRCEVCREAFGAVLTQAQPHTRIRVNWSPGQDRVSTLTAVGTEIEAMAAEVERRAEGVQVSHDQDALLVEFALSTSR